MRIGETVTTIADDGTTKSRKVLYAEDGMVLTNGKIFGTVIYLAEGVDESDFREITRKEYEKLEGSL